MLTRAAIACGLLVFTANANAQEELAARLARAVDLPTPEDRRAAANRLARTAVQKATVRLVIKASITKGLDRALPYHLMENPAATRRAD